MNLKYPLVSIHSAITNKELIIPCDKLRDIEKIRRDYGMCDWDKWKGDAFVLLKNGVKAWAELHWYQFGTAMVEIKFKNFI
jgi:hypothetical protein